MKTIIFVHGFMNNGSIWKEWETFFSQKGFDCYAPSWPYLSGSIEKLNEDPDSRLEDTTFDDVINFYIQKIKALDELPILIGHSLGGVIVQKLLNLGYGQGAICINSGPPKGIFTFNRNFILSNLQLMNPFSNKKLVLMNANWYHKYVTNDLSYDETVNFIKNNCVPSSRNIPKTISTIDFSKPHKPLLFIAGDKDKSQPVIINRKNYLAYTDNNSTTDLKVFSNRTHNVLSQNNWQEVALYISDWINNIIL